MAFGCCVALGGPLGGRSDSRQTAMTKSDLLATHERAWRDRPVIFGEPDGGFTPAEAAGALIAEHGLARALTVARERAAKYPGPWNFDEHVYRLLQETVDA